jgi:hypothetical protein
VLRKNTVKEQYLLRPWKKSNFFFTLWDFCGQPIILEKKIEEMIQCDQEERIENVEIGGA